MASVAAYGFRHSRQKRSAKVLTRCGQDAITDPLADAARGRSRADWLVGMNLSRAYTLAYGDELSVGRVQTPTLAMLVDRELAVRRFVPEDYLEVVAVFRPSGSGEGRSYRGTWFRDGNDVQKSSRLAPDGIEAEQIWRQRQCRPGQR